MYFCCNALMMYDAGVQYMRTREWRYVRGRWIGERVDSAHRGGIDTTIFVILQFDMKHTHYHAQLF